MRDAAVCKDAHRSGGGRVSPDTYRHILDAYSTHCPTASCSLIPTKTGPSISMRLCSAWCARHRRSDSRTSTTAPSCPHTSRGRHSHARSTRGDCGQGRRALVHARSAPVRRHRVRRAVPHSTVPSCRRARHDVRPAGLVRPQSGCRVTVSVSKRHILPGSSTHSSRRSPVDAAWVLPRRWASFADWTVASS